MNWTDWQSVKENVRQIYGKASRFFLFCNLLFYFSSCMVAGEPVGPVRFIGFLFYCCQWRVKSRG
jgi:hypothetical protein